MAKTRTLIFKVSRSFGKDMVRAGARVEVPEWWAARFIADGSAIEADDEPPATEPQPSAETATVTEADEKPKRSRKKNG